MKNEKAKTRYQVAFIGVQRFIWSPNFATLKAAVNWYERNAHRVVEDKQIIIHDGEKVIKRVYPDSPEITYTGHPFQFLNS